MTQETLHSELENLSQDRVLHRGECQLFLNVVLFLNRGEYFPKYKDLLPVTRISFGAFGVKKQDPTSLSSRAKATDRQRNDRMFGNKINLSHGNKNKNLKCNSPCFIGTVQ